MRPKIGRRLTEAETQKVAIMAAYIDASPHEWPNGVADIALLCHGYLDQQARIAQLETELAEAKNALMVSEQYRRAYAAGKFALYSMGGEITEAACKHLPCSEGPLDRYTDQIEREHSPRLVQDRAELIQQLEARESELAEARKDSERLAWAWANPDKFAEAQRRTPPNRTGRQQIDAARGTK